MKDDSKKDFWQWVWSILSTPDPEPEEKPRLTYDDIKNLPDPMPTVFEQPEMDLNLDETWIVDQLGDVWDNFLTLPIQNQDDVDDFRKAIHDAQRIVLSRSGWRQLRPNQEVVNQREAELDRKLEELKVQRDKDYHEFMGTEPESTKSAKDRAYDAPYPNKTYSPQTTGSGKAAKPPRR